MLWITAYPIGWVSYLQNNLIRQNDSTLSLPNYWFYFICFTETNPVLENKTSTHQNGESNWFIKMYYTLILSYEADFFLQIASAISCTTARLWSEREREPRCRAGLWCLSGHSSVYSSTTFTAGVPKTCSTSGSGNTEMVQMKPSSSWARSQVRRMLNVFEVLLS